MAREFPYWYGGIFGCISVSMITIVHFIVFVFTHNKHGWLIIKWVARESTPIHFQI